MNDTQLEKEVGGLLISAGAKPETAKRAAKVIGDGIRDLLTKERDLAAAGALLAARKVANEQANDFADTIKNTKETVKGSTDVLKCYMAEAACISWRIEKITPADAQAALVAYVAEKVRQEAELQIEHANKRVAAEVERIAVLEGQLADARERAAAMRGSVLGAACKTGDKDEILERLDAVEAALAPPAEKER